MAIAVVPLRSMTRIRLCGLTALLAAASACGPNADRPPYAPHDALQTFEIVDGYQIELVASEPLIADPVAMDIDEFGRIWVAEMPGYPLDTSGTGRIKVLRDTDNDGQPDDAVTYARGLRLPTGLMRWKQGVLVTDPPDVLYLPDEDDDLQADSHIVVLTGFALSNPQHNTNTPIYGLDNWIYLANNAPISWTTKFRDELGDPGSEVRFYDRPDGTRLARNGSDRNVRFRPDSGGLETLSGRSQFGHTFNAWGDHFLVDNSHHQYMEVIAARYLERRPDVPVASAIHHTPDQTDAATVYPITINPEHQLLTDRGVFTSACGLTWYLGGLFRPPYDRDVTFVAEPVHNLVHVDKVRPDGSVFAASRILEGREFLASTDSWFRPVNFSIGPDGALYVVDYYRWIVEHPEWMDDSLAAHGDITRGTDRGRIYRISPSGTAPLAWHGQLSVGHQATGELVQHLRSPNLWWRRHAQRLLVDRNDPGATALLSTLLTADSSAEARVHALHTLEGLGVLADRQIEATLRDPHPGVRLNALRLAEPRLERSTDLAQQLRSMASDPDARVRFQVLSSLAWVKAPELKRNLLWTDLEDDWVQTAALLSIREPLLTLLDRAMGRQDARTDGMHRFIARLSELIVRTDGPIPEILRDGPWMTARLEGAARGMTESALSPEIRTRLARLTLGTDHKLGESALSLMEVTAPHALQFDPLLTALDRTRSDSVRVRAIRLAALDSLDFQRLNGLLHPGQPGNVQSAAIEALSSQPGPAPIARLLQIWPTLTPSLRHAVLDHADSNERAMLVAEALVRNEVAPSDLLWRHRVRLMRDTDEPVRSQTRAILQLPAAGFGSLDASLAGSGNPVHGREVFRVHCALCHRAGEETGGVLGPDLATIRHWSRQALVNKLRRPNESVASGYEQWAIERLDGSVVVGIITDETPSAILLNTVNSSLTIARSEIKRLSAVSGTAMPAGLDVAMESADLVDLLSFLRSHP